MIENVNNLAVVCSSFNVLNMIERNTKYIIIYERSKDYTQIIRYLLKRN